jgi:hypothetical protein
VVPNAVREQVAIVLESFTMVHPHIQRLADHVQQPHMWAGSAMYVFGVQTIDFCYVCFRNVFSQRSRQSSAQQ